MNSEITPARLPFRAPLISRLEVRATLLQGLFADRGEAMKRFFLMAAIVTSLAISCAATTPVRAGGGDLGAGLIGGLAVGTIIGAAATAPPPVSALLLLDARRTCLGWLSRRMDLSCS